MTYMPIPNSDLNHVLKTVGPLFKLLHNESIFITGATGIIGKWFLSTINYASKIMGLNINIIALSRNPSAFINSYPDICKDINIHWIRGDVRTFDFNNLSKIKWAIHAATDVITHISPEDLLLTCSTGTENVIRQLASCNCKRMLLLSSGAIYGKISIPIDSIPENYIGGINTNSLDSAYAEGKRYSELISTILGKTYGIDIPIARCFAMVGPHLPLNKHFAIGNFINSVLSNSPILINGDGKPVRSYLYMADVITYLWLLLFAGRATSYNVGSNQPISILDLAFKVKEVLGSDVPVIVGNCDLHGAHANRYIPNTDLITNEFNLNSNISLEDSIEKTANWYSCHP